MVKRDTGPSESGTASRSRGLDYDEVELSAGPIEYVDEGTGDPVVFLHGFMVNAEVWRNVIPDLEGEFRCIAPTLPLGGHRLPVSADADLSPPGLVEILGEFLDRLELERATLVGNDAGGALCQLFVAASPERVHRLVLTNCDAFEAFPPTLFRPLQVASRLPGFTAFVATALRFDRVRRLPFTYGWVTEGGLPEATLEGYVRNFVTDPAVRRDATRMLRAVRPAYTLEAATAFPEFENPVLVLWGREDRIFPIEHAERFAEGFPDVELEYLDGSAAFVPEDRPATLANRVRAFLSGTEAANSDAQNPPQAA